MVQRKFQLSGHTIPRCRNPANPSRCIIFVSLSYSSRRATRLSWSSPNRSTDQAGTDQGSPEVTCPDKGTVHRDLRGYKTTLNPHVSLWGWAADFFSSPNPLGRKKMQRNSFSVILKNWLRKNLPAVWQFLHYYPVLFWLSCLGCLVLAVLSWQYRACSHVSAVPFGSLCSGNHVLAARSWLSGPGCLFPAVLSLLSFPGSPILLCCPAMIHGVNLFESTVWRNTELSAGCVLWNNTKTVK